MRTTSVPRSIRLERRSHKEEVTTTTMMNDLDRIQEKSNHVCPWTAWTRRQKPQMDQEGSLNNWFDRQKRNPISYKRSDMHVLTTSNPHRDTQNWNRVRSLRRLFVPGIVTMITHICNHGKAPSQTPWDLSEVYNKAGSKQADPKLADRGEWRIEGSLLHVGLADMRNVW